MTAFFIGLISNIKSPEKQKEYSQKAGQTFAAFGGELVLKGHASKILSGELDADTAAVFKFPSLNALNNWYNSDSYQVLIPLRNEAADFTIASFEVPT